MAQRGCAIEPGMGARLVLLEAVSAGEEKPE